MGKRSFRLPFLLLLAIAAATAAALSCFTAARRGLLLAAAGEGAPPEHPLDPSSLNETLLRLAADDPFAAEGRAEVARLLDGDLEYSPTSRRNYRSISLLLREHGRARSFAAIRLPSAGPELIKDWILGEFRRSLRRWSGDKSRFEPGVMGELLGLVKGPVDRHLGYPDTGRPYSTCAVVGNSGILLGSGHGDLIDGHDLVIRLNNARVQGYQRDVGSKTSLSFVNSNILHLCSRREHCFCHPYGDFVPLVMYICQPVHFLDYMVCNASHRAPLLVTDGRFDTLCARIVKYYSLKRFVELNQRRPAEWGKTHDERAFHYSSGMQAIMLALGICDQVSVFGFGKSAAAKHHYHTNQRAELDLHDYEAEYAFYRDLVERPQVIPFLKDSGIKVPPVVFYH